MRGYSVVYGGLFSVCRADGIVSTFGPLALFLCLAENIIILYFPFFNSFLQDKPDSQTGGLPKMDGPGGFR
jgi:hypothetical protein